jgi:hypothetical protein
LKFRGGFSQVKRKQILAAFLGAAVLLSLSGCGTSDKMASVTVTQRSSSSSGGFFNLKGIGSTLQLTVTANYTSGKTVDVTNWVKFTVNPEGTDDLFAPLLAPPFTMTVSPTGMLTAVDPATCTWVNQGSNTTPAWFLQGDYMITATYKGIVSQPVFIGVASRSGGGPNGSCGP